jgi:hypothetical protein
VGPVLGFSYHARPSTLGGRRLDLCSTAWMGNAQGNVRPATGRLQPAFLDEASRFRRRQHNFDLQCMAGPQDGMGWSRLSGEKRLRASSAQAIPEVSRQSYQDAALSGLITVGQEVPREWVEDDQFAFLEECAFKDGEVVVVALPDGNQIFGKIQPRAAGSSTAEGEVSVPTGSYSVAISVSRLGTKYVDLAAANVGKILALSQREIQRLGSSKLSSKITKTAVLKNVGLFSSIRDLVDVDKKSAREKTLPFQPMLSRRAVSPPPAQAEVKVTPKPEGRVSSVMSGADSGDWGEIDGWWSNEIEQTDTFEVLLQRPLGMDLDEVEGEGIYVKTVKEGGNAQRAGVRVGDRIQVPGSNMAAGWKEDLVSVLSAISASTGNRMRLRYLRSSAATSSSVAPVASDSKQQVKP